MTALSLLTLAGAMFILAITPGPGVFATVARALASGFSHASVVVLGIVTGDLIFVLLALYGLSAIAELLGDFFTLAKYLGAAYLIYLGLKLWRQPAEKIRVEGIEEFSWGSNYFSGLLITLSNPKVILFYLGFLPTFIDLATLDPWELAAVVAIVSGVLGATLLIYAYSAAKARKLFQSPSAEKVLNRSAGSVMIATGAVLAINS